MLQSNAFAAGLEILSFFQSQLSEKKLCTVNNIEENIPEKDEETKICVKGTSSRRTSHTVAVSNKYSSVFEPPRAPMTQRRFGEINEKVLYIPVVLCGENTRLPLKRALALRNALYLARIKLTQLKTKIYPYLHLVAKRT